MRKEDAHESSPRRFGVQMNPTSVKDGVPQAQLLGAQHRVLDHGSGACGFDPGPGSFSSSGEMQEVGSLQTNTRSDC